MTDHAAVGALRTGRPFFCVYNMQKWVNKQNKYKNLKKYPKKVLTKPKDGCIIGA